MGANLFSSRHICNNTICYDEENEVLWTILVGFCKLGNMVDDRAEVSWSIQLDLSDALLVSRQYTWEISFTIINSSVFSTLLTIIILVQILKHFIFYKNMNLQVRYIWVYTNTLFLHTFHLLYLNISKVCKIILLVYQDSTVIPTLKKMYNQVSLNIQVTF